MYRYAAVHVSCSEQPACQSLVEAVSARDADHFASRTDRRAAANHRRHVQGRQGGYLQPESAKTLSWSEHHTWGVMPGSVCEANGARDTIDVRGNNLMGVPPTCMWESHAAEDVLLSRNNFVGTVGRLSPTVRRVHVGYNNLEGDIGDVFGGAASAPGGSSKLAHIVANGNKFTSRVGLAGLSGGDSGARLKKIDFGGNRLGPAGSGAMAAHLGELRALRSYHIGGNAWDHRAAAEGAAEGARFAGVHVDVSLRLPTGGDGSPFVSARSILSAVCGACHTHDAAHDVGGASLVALLRHCSATRGCTRNKDGSAKAEPPVGARMSASHAPNGIDAIECALRSALATSPVGLYPKP
jgi:hypothetical protein